MAREVGAMITFNDAQYMVDNQDYTALDTIPNSNELMTRSAIEYYLDIDTTYGNFSSYSSNELVPYQELKSNAPTQLPTGGVITEIDENGTTYRIHSFTSTGVFDPKGHTLSTEYIVVGGGGGGGHIIGVNRGAGGGGAGEYISGTTTISSTMNITIGAGGNQEQNGGDTSMGNITAIGGGAGAGAGTGFNGSTGASGGGGSATYQGGTSGKAGISQKGHAGGDGGSTPRAGGGGGGYLSAGKDNTQGSLGGNGITNDINGNSIVYAQGGKGGINGDENTTVYTNPDPTAYSGSGGYGAYSIGASGTTVEASSGASGVVIIKYVKP